MGGVREAYGVVCACLGSSYPSQGDGLKVSQDTADPDTP